MADLDAERIAAAAIAVATKRGVAGFSMRAIADALDVTPMALYHHVRNKAELVALLVDASIRRHPPPRSTGEWRDDLFSMAQWMREHSRKQPEIAHLGREYQVWTPATLQMTERWLGLWQQSGLDLKQAIQAATMSSMAITGLVAEEVLYSTMKRPSAAILNSLPNVRTMFNIEHNRDAEFELVVRALIEGLHARMTRRKRKARAASRK